MVEPVFDGCLRLLSRAPGFTGCPGCSPDVSATPSRLAQWDGG
jgi:hypothetical protein